MTDLSMLCDSHVHSEHSWDAAAASMVMACRQALQQGLAAVAFTDHADFTPWTLTKETADSRGIRMIDAHATSGELDVDAYFDELERCRSAFIELEILAGVELGEPHRFTHQAARVLGAGPFERVLGAVHHVERDGALLYAPKLLTPRQWPT